VIAGPSRRETNGSDDAITEGGAWSRIWGRLIKRVG
jgi:hypothetical protein